MEETTYEAIRRLQQQVDRIDQQIESKRQRIQKNRFNGPIERIINNEIKSLLDRRETIKRNILQLKQIELKTT